MRKYLGLANEAIDAAAFALYSAAPWPAEWHEADGARQETYLHYAALAIEAAAPHMLAEAFEQGQKSGIRHAARLAAAVGIGRPELLGPLSPNPYRPTK